METNTTQTQTNPLPQGKFYQQWRNGRSVIFVCSMACAFMLGGIMTNLVLMGKPMYGYAVALGTFFAALGMYVGIGGVLTFRNARKLAEAAEAIPMDRIVLETDCPYMAPEPHRGTRNDPRNLRYVVRKLADIKKLPPEEVVRITTENAMRVYRI